MINSVLSRLGIEVWKDIPEFKNYQVSNLGNVRNTNYRNLGKSRLKKKHLNSNNRYNVGLHKNNKKETKQISSLVAITFLNHKPCGLKLVVDHIDNNKINDKLYNLQIITQRENCIKDRKNKTGYTGVYKNSSSNYVASISINGKIKNLGTYKTKIKASQAYQNELKKII